MNGNGLTPDILLQAVEAAVSAAVADAEMRTAEEVAAASAAMKACFRWPTRSVLLCTLVSLE